MRVFFALEIESRSRDAIRRMAKSARQYCRGRFVQDTNYHITLRFLGEQPYGQVQKIKEMLLEEGQKAFSYRIGGYGRFRRGRGDILWMGISRGQEKLAALKQSLDTRLSALGYPPEERSYHPHITLARDVAWEPEGYDQLRERESSIEETAEGVTLMESRTTAEGVRYIPLMRWALAI